MKRFIQNNSTLIFFIFGFGVSMLAFYLALQDIPFSLIQHALFQANWFFVLMTFVSVIANILAKTFRWQVLLGEEGKKIPFHQLLVLLMMGQLWNQVYPIRVGDIGRAWMYDSAGSNKIFILSTVAVEKLLDTIAYGILVIVSLGFITLPPQMHVPTYFLILLAFGFMLVVLAFTWRGNFSFHRWIGFFSWLPAGIQRILFRWIKSVAESFHILRTNWRSAFVTTLLIWLTALGNIYCVFWALSIQFSLPIDSLKAMILLLVTLQIGITLPSAPLTVGVFQYICKFVLQIFGVEGAVGVTFGVLLQLITMLPIVFIGSFGAIITWNKTYKTNKNRTRQESNDMDSNAEVNRPGRVEILGVNVSCLTKSDLIRTLIGWAKDLQPRSVLYANAHTLNLAYNDHFLQQVFNSADIVFADGFGVVLAARFLHATRLEKLVCRVWVEDFCTQAAEENLQLFILAGKPGVAEEAGQSLIRRIPGLKIVGSQNGFFLEDDIPGIIEKINHSQPSVVFVGLGSPNQEIWLSKYRNQISAKLCVVVGAYFDYLAGYEKSVPEWLDYLGLEWFWRLIVDPFGKWRRYLIGNPRFAMRVLKQKFSR